MFSKSLTTGRIVCTLWVLVRFILVMIIEDIVLCIYLDLHEPPHDDVI